MGSGWRILIWNTSCRMEAWGNSLKFIWEFDALYKLKMLVQVHIEIAENFVVKYIREAWGLCFWGEERGGLVQIGSLCKTK